MNLKTFLDEKKVQNQEKILTHVNMNGGKYSIPSEENELFLKYYLEALNEGKHYYLSECFLPGKLIRFVVDLEIRPEFRQENVSNQTVQTEIIPELITQLNGLIEKQTLLNNPRYILSQRAPYLAHINYPNVVISLKLAKELINDLRDLMTKLFPEVKWEKALDSGIYCAGKGLRILGSLSKKELKPEELPYYKPFDTETGEYRDITLQDLLDTSIRTVVDDPQLAKLEYHDTSHYMERKELSNTDDIIAPYIEEIRNDNVFKDHGLDIDKIKEVFTSNSDSPCFVVQLKDRYCPFIKRTHKRSSYYLYLWITKNGTVMKCYDDDCSKHHMPEKPIKLNMTMKKKYYSESEKEEEKEEVIPENYQLTPQIIEKIDDCLSNGCTHYDIAQLIYHIYQDRFRVEDFNNRSVWYEFKNHRFHKHSNHLSLLISGDLPFYFKKYKQEICGGKNDTITELIVKLKSLSFKNNVLTEASNIFYHHHQDFVESMDSKQNLICFTNGILDLDTFEFRDGHIDDCISLSTRCEYVPYDPEHEKVKEIYTFFSSLFPDKEVMEYQMKKIALCLHGKCQEEFNIWTGNGCFGRDTPMLTYSGQIVKVQDIKHGDLLLGDDLTERKVMDVFSGTDDMYRLTFKNNSEEPMIINSEHKLVFLSEDTLQLQFDNDSITVSWQVLLPGALPQLREKVFYASQVYYDWEKLFSEATKFKEQVATEEENYIKSGTQIILKLKDYLSLEKSITNKYYQYRVSSSNHFRGQSISLEDAFYEGKVNIFAEEVPEEVRLGNEEIRINYIAGMLEMQGFDIYNPKKYEHFIVSVNPKITTQIKFICQSLDLGFELLKDDKVKISSFLPERKYILQVEHLGQDQYYGFEVNKNHLFLGPDFSVLSNSNGKSKLCLLIQKAFGDYWNESPVALFTKPRNSSSAPSPEVMDLKGRRITTVQEPEKNDKLNTGLMKQFTGNDYISARQLHKQQEKFRLQTKFVLCCNKIPQIECSDGGSWRRIKVVEFTSKFVMDPTKDHEFHIDPNLEEKIKTWGPFFVSILVHYFKLYGKSKIRDPTAVKNYTAEIRKDYDIFSQFVEQNLAEDKDTITTFTEIHSIFEAWCESNNIKTKLYTKTEVKKYLADIYGREKKFKVRDEYKTGFLVKIIKQEIDLE